MAKARPNRPYHILVVDDDTVNLSILAEGLAAAGYTVTSAESGEEALQCAAGAQFDLAIVDMQMSGISGAELARQLLARFACFSLILSGRDDPQSVRAAIEDGALGYLIKPLDVSRLVPSIETALARSAEMSALARSRENLTLALKEGRETSVAVGILVERMHLNRDTAFGQMRELARVRRLRVNQVAEEIVHAAEILNHSGTAGR